MRDERTDVLYGSLSHHFQDARLAADDAAWQHATGIVARFFKIQDERT